MGGERVARLPRAVGRRREHARHAATNGDFAADVEVARDDPARAELPGALDGARRGRDARHRHVRAGSRSSSASTSRRRRRRCRTRSRTGRSCSRSSAATTGSRRRSSRPRSVSRSGPPPTSEIRAAFGASGGSLGPVGFEGEVVADFALQEGQFVAGANRDGFHLRGVEAGRDYEPRFADLRASGETDDAARSAAAR